eukprot:788655-Prorocentrum_minimum.AAC.1
MRRSTPLLASTGSAATAPTCAPPYASLSLYGPSDCFVFVVLLSLPRRVRQNSDRPGAAAGALLLFGVQAERGVVGAGGGRGQVPGDAAGAGAVLSGGVRGVQECHPRARSGLRTQRPRPDPPLPAGRHLVVRRPAAQDVDPRGER